MSTSTRVTLVDYGRGNLHSITRALAHLGAEAVVTDDPGEIESADRLLLPGVGAFGDGMQALRERGLVDPLRRFCAQGRPLLGICLGMQLLMKESPEFGRHEGLGIIPGRVVRFQAPHAAGPRYKIPQIGWNRVLPGPAASCRLLSGLEDGGFFYFAHSFYIEPEEQEHCAGETEYGGRRFCSILESGSISGCQFHPEKSAEAGLRLLRNWLTRGNDR